MTTLLMTRKINKVTISSHLFPYEFVEKYPNNIKDANNLPFSAYIKHS